jgi:exodeoxyribonuclease VIII
LHFRARQLAANDNGPTPAQAFGTAFHALVLEPEVFTREYCLAVRQSDVPDAIDSRDQLLVMMAELNATRLPKLATTGTKAELVDRLADVADRAELEALGLAELKLMIQNENAKRPGLLPTSGSMGDLAHMLRINGRNVTLWADVKSEWMRNNGHRKVLEQDTWDRLHNMRAAVMAHPAARAALTAKGKAEQSVYWTDPTTGVLCRIRPDYWRDDDIIVDLKSTHDASPDGFAKSVLNFGYHCQNAMYVDGATAAGRPPKHFVFVAVENDACVIDGQAKGVGVYILDDEAVALGRVEYRADLVMYAECLNNDQWPCYGDSVQKLSLPAWHMNRNAHLLEQSA